MQQTSQQALDAALLATKFTGASFAYWDGNVLHTAVAGQRNSVTSDPVTLDTAMHIGSITKVFNAALLMQVVDDGLVSLDEPVARYLPELRLAPTLAKLPVRSLVNHTSGLAGDVIPDQGPDRERIEDAVARIAAIGQIHAPGALASYSNAGTVIAGYLVQKLRDCSWYTLVQKRIFDPLDMKHALADLTDLPKFRVSVGDITNPATGQRAQTSRPFLPLSYAPAGATLMMSATDLVTFGRALVGGGVGPNGNRILSSESAAAMYTETARFYQPDHGIGLGWMLMPGGVVWHGGGGPGVVSLLYAHPATGRAVAMLTNCDSSKPALDAMIDPVLASWTGPLQPRRAPAAPVDLQRMEGTYSNGLFEMRVAARDGTLFVQSVMKFDFYDHGTDEQPANPYVPLGDGVFGLQAQPGNLFTQIRFVMPDENGRPQGLGMAFRFLPRVKAADGATGR